MKKSPYWNAQKAHLMGLLNKKHTRKCGDKGETRGGLELFSDDVEFVGGDYKDRKISQSLNFKQCHTVREDYFYSFPNKEGFKEGSSGVTIRTKTGSLDFDVQTCSAKEAMALTIAYAEATFDNGHCPQWGTQGPTNKDIQARANIITMNEFKTSEAAPKALGTK